MTAKTRRFVILFLLTIVPFSAGAQDISIYFEGTASLEHHRQYFLNNFSMEAEALGYIVTEERTEADYIFNFNVEPIGRTPIRYNIQISLFQNETGSRLVTFGWEFTTLEEMYYWNQYLFLQAMILWPRPLETEIITLEPEVIVITEPINDDWRNRRLYLRLSVNYPVTFYALQGNGLIGGAGVYHGSFDSPDMIMPLDNRIFALPGATVGLEWHLLNWLSLEVNFQISLGDTITNDFINMIAGAELKFPLKPGAFMLEPYLAFSYNINKSEVFAEFPDYAVGGGIQIGIKGGNRGAFFIDINYMYSFDEAVLKNPYGELYPHPAIIYFRRSVIGLGIGYKWGIF